MIDYPCCVEMKLTSCSRWFSWTQVVTLLVETLHISFWGNILQHCIVKWQRCLKISQTNTPTHTWHTVIPTKRYHILNDRQSVKTCVHLICLGIKTGRQLRNLRQQSIPQTICFHHLYEPNDYLQPAVSTERMNKFMGVLWTAWGARINLHVFHAWIWAIDSQMRIKFCILICHWSNYKQKHNLYYSVFFVVLSF